jgi:hypothetical protein
MCERVYHAVVDAAQHMSFESAITIILTALGVMLAVVTLGIAALAIWGYFGIRDSVKEMASKKVDEAMAEALKKYPVAADMLRIMKRLGDQADFLDQMRNQSVTAQEPKFVEMASKPDVQEGVGETPLESIEKQATPIARLPGEEEK